MLDANTPTPSFDADPVSGDTTYSFQLVVYDGSLYSPSDLVEVLVLPSSAPPAVPAIATWALIGLLVAFGAAAKRRRRKN